MSDANNKLSWKHVFEGTNIIFFKIRIHFLGNSGDPHNSTCQSSPVFFISRISYSHSQTLYLISYIHNLLLSYSYILYLISEREFEGGGGLSCPQPDRANVVLKVLMPYLLTYVIHTPCSLAHTQMSMWSYLDVSVAICSYL